MGAHACWPLLLLVAYLTLRLTNEDEAFAVTSALLIFTLIFCVLIAICFPVKGPRQSLSRLDADGLGYFSSKVVLFFADLGVGNKLSLPSQRIALSVSLWLSTMRYNAYLACAMALFVPGIAVGTIYAGLNYTLDVIIGVFIASVSYTMGSQVVVWMYSNTLRQRDLWNAGGCCKLDQYDLSHDSELKYATERDRLTTGDAFI